MTNEEKKYVIELMDKYTDNLCKTIDGKMYELITRSQLLNILADYKGRDFSRPNPGEGGFI